jgi:Domain of unknown function (DUF1707)
MPVATGPEYRAAAPERSRLRAADSDREQAIGALQAAFTQGRLTKDELVAPGAGRWPHGPMPNLTR